MSPDPPVVLRCATIVFRGTEVLVVRRSACGDWVLPGGRPCPGEGVLGCARREVREETGLDVDPGQCAFVLETIDSSGEQRVIEVVFLSPDRPACADLLAELADHGPAPVRRTTGHLLDGDDQDGGDQGGDERGEVGE